MIGGIFGGALSILSGGGFLKGFEEGAFAGMISGAIFGGLGGAGQIVCKAFASSCKALKIISTTFKVSTGITLAMGGFDLVSVVHGVGNPNNPLFVLNHELHKSGLYNGFQLLASGIAAFSGGAYLEMRKVPATCFIAGTMILTGAGLVAIENIKVGTKVISTDPYTFLTEERSVVQTFINKALQLVRIMINDEEITTTVEHPFYVKERGFVRASELRIGDEVVQAIGERYRIEAISIYVVEKPETVYNFEVEEFHTYYVGGNSILVHNKCRNVIVDGSNDVNNIETPYGPAVQDVSDEALGVRNYVEQGGDLYRGGTLGRSNTTDAQFWATESPMSTGYASKYGVDFDSLDYVIKGKIKPGTNFVTRPAPSLGNNTGGAIEVVTPPNSVKFDFFHMIGGK